MPLKTSFFHKELFRKNLTRFWPLWGMASFGGAVLPLAIIANLPGWAPANGALEGRSLLYSALCYAVPILSLLYAILCAAAVWSYLYNARSAGLMHTLPIRRASLFATNVLSGLTMMAIPYAVTGLLTALAFALAGCFDLLGFLVTIAGVIGESLFFFALATLCAFLTGNVFMLPALYFVLNFLEPLLDFLVNQFAGGFIFGLRSDYSGALEWLSPVVYLEQTVGYHSRYEEVTDGYGSHSVMTAVWLKNGHVILFYALVGVLLLALAWLLCRAHRSETAGDVVALRPARPVFRYGVAALCAMGGGLVLYALFFMDRFGGENNFRVVPLVLCMTVGGLIGYYAAGMLLHKSLRVFRGSLPGAAAVLAFSVLLCTVLRFDLLGVAKRVPEIGEVRSVEFYAGSNTYYFYPGEEDALLEEVRALHKQITAEQGYIRSNEKLGYYPTPLPESGLTYAEQAQYTTTYVRLDYVLRSGLHVSRYYQLPLNRARMAQSGTYDCMLDRLVNSEPMKRKRLRLGDDRYTFQGGSLYLEARNMSLDLNSREAQAILEAVARDGARNAWGFCDWFRDDDADQYAMNLAISFYRRQEDGSQNVYDSIFIIVRPGMAETIACLKELGLAEDGDFKTYRELRPWNYFTDEETAQFEERYGMTPRAYYQEYGDLPVGARILTASGDVMEIIGGADSLITAFVTGPVN